MHSGSKESLLAVLRIAPVAGAVKGVSGSAFLHSFIGNRLPNTVLSTTRPEESKFFLERSLTSDCRFVTRPSFPVFGAQKILDNRLYTIYSRFHLHSSLALVRQEMVAKGAFLLSRRSKRKLAGWRSKGRITREKTETRLRLRKTDEGPLAYAAPDELRSAH